MMGTETAVHRTNAWIRNFPFRTFGRFAIKLDPYRQAQLLIRVSYFFLLFIAVYLYPRYNASLVAEMLIDPLWPVWWISMVPPHIAFNAIRVFSTATLLAAALFPERRPVRLFAFLGLLELVSFYSPTHALDTDWFTWLMVLFLAIFLPDGWPAPHRSSIETRERFLLVFWGCQAIQLLSYTMAGTGKVIAATWQIAGGQSYALSWDAAARQIAAHLSQVNQTSILGAWIIAHPWVAWPFSVGSLFLLTFSLWAAFRPSLHRLWGMGLILFHVGNFLALNLAFPAHIFLNGIFLVNTPFRSSTNIWRTRK